MDSRCGHPARDHVIIGSLALASGPDDPALPTFIGRLSTGRRYRRRSTTTSCQD